MVILYIMFHLKVLMVHLIKMIYIEGESTTTIVSHGRANSNICWDCAFLSSLQLPFPYIFFRTQTPSRCLVADLEAGPGYLL